MRPVTVAIRARTHVSLPTFADSAACAAASRATGTRNGEQLT